VAIIIIVLVVAVGIVVYVSRGRLLSRPRRRRQAELEQVADRLGFTYEHDQQPFTAMGLGFDERLYRSVPLLSQAFYGYPHLLRGTTDTGPTCVFDVRFGNVADGKSDPQDPYRITLAAFHLADVDLPQFALRPERAAQKIGQAVFAALHATIGDGSHDLDFPGHQGLSDAYALRGDDEDAVRALFGPALIEVWEQLDRSDLWAAGGAGNWLVLYRDREQPGGGSPRNMEVAPEDVEAFLRQAETIALAFRRAAT
jgi:hypothetical protein